MFRASLCPSSGEQDCALPHMVLCTGSVGCGCVELGLELCALWRLLFDWARVPAPHNHSHHNQCGTPDAAVHTLVLLMMGTVMPETCWDRSLIINTRLVTSCWFLSLHPKFMTHGHKSLKNKGWRCSRNVEPDSALICCMFLSDAAMYLVCKIWGFHSSVFDNSGLLWCDTVSYWTAWRRRQCHSPEDLNPILNMDACDSNVEQINSDTHYMMQRHNDSACLWQCWNCYLGLCYADKYVYVLEAGFISLEVEGKGIDCSESIRMNYSLPSAFVMKVVKLSDITYISRSRNYIELLWIIVKWTLSVLTPVKINNVCGSFGNKIHSIL